MVHETVRKNPKNPKKKVLTAKFNCLARINSMKDSTALSMRPIFEVYVNFCKETTLHGLKHTVADNLHFFERWLWLVMTIVAFGGAIICALTQLSRYQSEPVVVSLQREYRSWWTTFPAITACFMDRVQQDKARDIIEQKWNVTEEGDPEKYQYYYSLIELVSDVSFRTNLQNFWKYQTDDTVKEVDLMQLALDVHPTFPLKVTVSKRDKEVQWIPVMTEMGICMLFNSAYASHQFILRDLSWIIEPLLKCHYHSGMCYVRVDTLNNAVRYFVHSPYDIPTAISNPTGAIVPGQELVIDFKSVEIQASSSVKKLTVDQRRCRYPDEWISNTIRAYSYGLCQMHCRTRMAIMFCGCRPYFHVIGVLPLGLDVGLAGVAAFYLTRLKKPSHDNVYNIFGPEPSSKESELQPERVVKCIAHRGAGFDAPENTIEAFKYCVERDCNFVELDVRSSADGQLVLLHDKGLQRLAASSITDVRTVDWEKIKDIDVGANHPNKHQFKDVRLCLLDEALDYLLENEVRVIIDVKGEDKKVINGILKTFATRPSLYKYAAITCFNPFVLYQIRRKDPEIVGALSYRPYCFSAQNYDAENGPTNPRFPDNLPLQTVLQGLDYVHSTLWRLTARWCNVTAVLLHKDIVNVAEVSYWRSLDVRCCGWSINRPVEKLYWRGVLRSPYLANTLVGEFSAADSNISRDSEKIGVKKVNGDLSSIVYKLNDKEKIINSGLN